MSVYTVLTPSPGHKPADPMAVVFIKEGFNWPALFVAGLWLIYRRLWLVLLGYLLVSIGLTAAAEAISPGLSGVTMAAVHLLFALEANGLRRWTLERRGYRLAAVVQGRGVEEAEIRYFADVDATPIRSSVPPVVPAPPQPSAPPAPPSAEAGEVIGLFPTPGGAT